MLEFRLLKCLSRESICNMHIAYRIAFCSSVIENSEISSNSVTFQPQTGFAK